MAVSTVTVDVAGRAPNALLAPLAGAYASPRSKLRGFARLLSGLALGVLPGAGTRRPKAVIGTAVASGTLTLASASGSVGGTINGVAVTVTAAGGDAASAALLAAAINASVNAAHVGIVTAASSGAVVTVSAAVAGAVGNAITLVASGTGVTASGAKLSGGASSVVAL